MPLSVTVTPGYSYAIPSGNDPGEALKYPDLNLGFNPTITLAGQVSSAQIASGAVTEAKYGAGSIPQSALKDDIIGAAQLAAQTPGSVLTFDASGDPVFISPGTSGYVLTSAGAGAQPSWAAAVSVDLNPNNLPDSITWDDVAADDNILVGDTSAGKAVKVTGAESPFGTHLYVQQIYFRSAGNVAPAFGDGPPDAEDASKTMASVTDSLGTSGNVERLISVAPYGGEVIKVKATNMHTATAGSAVVDIIKLEAPPNHYTGTAHTSLAQLSTGSLTAGASANSTHNSSNTFSEGDMMVIRCAGTTANLWRVTVYYKLNRL